MSVQDALTSVGNGDLADWKGNQAGFWFAGSWFLAAGMAFSVLWRQPTETADGHRHDQKRREFDRQVGREKMGEEGAIGDNGPDADKER